MEVTAAIDHALFSPYPRYYYIMGTAGKCGTNSVSDLSSETIATPPVFHTEQIQLNDGAVHCVVCLCFFGARYRREVACLGRHLHAMVLASRCTRPYPGQKIPMHKQ